MSTLATRAKTFKPPTRIGRFSTPPETLSGFAASGRSTVHLLSSVVPSNSSERTGPVGHSSSGRVTRTSTVSEDLPPDASVTVTVAV